MYQTPKPRHRLGLSRRLGEGHGKCTQEHHVGPGDCDQVQGLRGNLAGRLDIASRHITAQVQSMSNRYPEAICDPSIKVELTAAGHFLGCSAVQQAANSQENREQQKA